MATIQDLDFEPSSIEPTEGTVVPASMRAKSVQHPHQAGDLPVVGREHARMVYLLAKSFHAIRARHLEPAFRNFDLTPLQYTILSTVHDHPGLSSADLSRRFYASPQNMGQILGSLESRKLIWREENPENRRMLLVSTTVNGATIVESCHREMDLIEKALFEDMEADDQAALRRCLLHLAAKAQVG